MGGTTAEKCSTLFIISKGSNCAACPVIPYIKRTFWLKYAVREIFVGYVTDGNFTEYLIEIQDIL